MNKKFDEQIANILNNLKEKHLYKDERVITSSQSNLINVGNKNEEVINLCANNYLGLANNQLIAKKAKKALGKYGYGTSSVRFICGTMDIHKKLEKKIASYLGFDDAITFAACFDANAAVFEGLFDENDAIISDKLNHASIIDGIRLCKAKRYLYENNDMASLEEMIKKAKNDARNIVIVSDGVFSMDGIIANLSGIRKLADKYDCLVLVDDSHATGVIGKNGRGSFDYCNIKVDILTSTLGKALGGGMGGFIASSTNVINLLRQKARPYLFSNALTPALCAGAICAINLAKDANVKRKYLFELSQYFRKSLSDAGFDLAGKDHPIVPIMVYEAEKAQLMCKDLYEKNIYLTGFFFPVVPQGKARIRVQLSSEITYQQIDYVIENLIEIGKKYNVIK